MNYERSGLDLKTITDVGIVSSFCLIDSTVITIYNMKLYLGCPSWRDNDNDNCIYCAHPHIKHVSGELLPFRFLLKINYGNKSFLLFLWESSCATGHPNIDIPNNIRLYAIPSNNGVNVAAISASLAEI